MTSASCQDVETFFFRKHMVTGRSQCQDFNGKTLSIFDIFPTFRLFLVRALIAVNNVIWAYLIGCL